MSSRKGQKRGVRKLDSRRRSQKRGVQSPEPRDRVRSSEPGARAQKPEAKRPGVSGQDLKSYGPEGQVPESGS